MGRERWSTFPLALFALVACHDERPSPHVYSSPPPTPPKVAAGPATPRGPEVQIGTTGAEARITAVVDAATGAPIALTNISQPIEVMTLVARGPGRPPSENARVDLLMHGTEEAMQTLVLDAPASTIVAHSFSVPVAGNGRTGLRAGRYTVQVRIVGGDGRVLASSAPIYLELRAQP
jgi:hypothetical protein